MSLSEPEPEIASDGQDETIDILTFDVKSVGDLVMTAYQIEHAYMEMSLHAANFDRPDMEAAFKIAAFRTLEDFYLTLMEHQSRKIKSALAEHGKDIAKGIEEKGKRVAAAWKAMEDAARSDICFLCLKPVLPEEFAHHLDETHPRRDPLGVGERAEREVDQSDDPVEAALLKAEEKKLEARWNQANAARKESIVLDNSGR